MVKHTLLAIVSDGDLLDVATLAELLLMGGGGR